MRGWRTVAEMQARELLRRRGALALLMAIPLAWYVAEAASGVDWAIGAGTIGVAWSAGVAALFSVLGARRVDPRLVQAGLPRGAIVAGRLVALLSAALAVALASAPSCSPRATRNVPPSPCSRWSSPASSRRRSAGSPPR